MRLRHLKARHGEPRDLVLEFNGSLQRFSSLPKPTSGAAGRKQLQLDVEKLWETTPVAGDDEAGEEE
jgi:hypothetical protein